MEKFPKQECIPVRFVPPTAVAMGGGVGCLPQCMLGYTPQVWAWRPPQARPLNFPLGVGRRPVRHAAIPLWRPVARHAGIPPAMHAGIPPPL